MTPKIQYKVDNTIKYSVQAFQHNNNNNLDDTLNNARKACEAICRAVILHHKGEINGEKIILGEIKYNGQSTQPFPDGTYKIPLLDSLLKTIQPLINNSSLYHRFQDIRFGGNNASHDAISVNSQVKQEDVELCVSQFKQILVWFWGIFLNTPLPQPISHAFEGRIDETLLVDFDAPEWDSFYQNCNGFSKEQKFVLIAPPNLNELTENQLAVLGRLNWVFVIDFNPQSKTNGLFSAFQQELGNRQIKPITIEQKEQKNLVSTSNLSINWLFANGLEEGGVKLGITQTEREWERTMRYPQFIEKLIASLLLDKMNSLHFIFLWDEIPYVRNIIQKIDGIANSNLIKYTLIYTQNDKLQRLQDEFGKYDISLFRLSIAEITEGVARVKATSNNQHDKQARFIPARNSEGRDISKDVSGKYITFVDNNIEILYKQIEHQEDNITSENSFFKGNTISWKEISLDKDVRRNKLSDLLNKIQAQLNTSKGAYTIELHHQTGAGGTTLARRVAFDLHGKYPTVFLSKYQKHKTREMIFDLAEFTQKPIVIIVEAFQVEETELRILAREINSDKKHVVFLYVKRTFTNRIKEDSKTVFLDDKMLDISERNRFIDKYSQIVSGKSKVSIEDMLLKSIDKCEVIDFALAAYEEDYSAISLESYILTFLNRIPSNQLQFVGFASLIYHYTQNSTSEYWLEKLFKNGSLSSELSDRPIEERFIKKIFIQDLDSQGADTGMWRPRFSRFGKEILQLSLVGLSNKVNKNNWKDYLAQWSVDFINFCKGDNQYLSYDLRDLLKSLFLNRDYEDILGIDEDYESPQTSNKKFAQIFRDISNKDGQTSVFKSLVDCFPEEAHFRGHLGRFYFETAVEPQEFELAHDEILNAIELGENDYNLWHLKGMCNRRTIEFLIRSNKENMEQSELDDLENFIKELTVIANADFAKSREINPHNLHSHTAQMQMLVKVINFGKDLLPNQSKEDFISNKDNAWYEDRLNEIFTLVDESEYIIELSKSLEQSKGLDRSKNMISSCEASTFKILGNFTKAIDRFKSLSESAERSARPYFGKMFVYSTLASKVNNNRKEYKNAWNKLSEYEFLSIKKVLERNIREQPENPQNFKLWLQAVRSYNSFVSIDDCLSVVKSWYDNSGKFELANLEATYYRYVLHASKAISEGDTFGDLDVKEAKKYLSECKSKTPNDKFSFEWFGKGKGLKTLVNHHLLGSMGKEKGFFEDTTLLGEVEGIIINVVNRQRGEIKLKCGLNAFFTPINGGFEKKDETEPVKFFIGFRYNELVAWEVKRIQSNYLETQPIEIEIDIEGLAILEEEKEIEQVEIADLEKKEVNETIHSETPKLQGLTVLGKIDLTQFDRYKKKRY